jgi:hypothetical protein
VRQNKLEDTHNTLQVSLAKTAKLETVTKKMQAEVALIMSLLGGLEKLFLCINFTKTHMKNAKQINITVYVELTDI